MAGGRSRESVDEVEAGAPVKRGGVETAALTPVLLEPPIPAGCGITASTSAILAFSSPISLSFFANIPVGKKRQKTAKTTYSRYNVPSIQYTSSISLYNNNIFRNS